MSEAAQKIDAGKAGVRPHKPYKPQTRLTPIERLAAKSCLDRGAPLVVVAAAFGVTVMTARRLAKEI